MSTEQLQILEKKADEITRENAFSILRQMSVDQKKYVLGFLIAIGKVDNDPDPRESLIITLIGVLISYPINDFEELSNFYLSHKNLIFLSSNHKRYEHGILVSNDYVPRTIIINLQNGGLQMSVQIEPTLSLKRANLIESTNNVITYLGEDPDYKFVIESNDDNKNIVRFSVFRLDRDLEIRYV